MAIRQALERSLLGDPPGRPPQLGIIDSPDRAAFEMFKLGLRVLGADLPVQQPEVQGRARLGP
ncbi:MAG TPA: hypothetical protein VN732_05310, partial [Solirubrobacterales bacterium]|nr:hypothetical protein [Solirubrobacterales bacterium]